MAAKTQSALTATLKVLRWAALGVFGAILLFLLAAWIGSSISRNPDWQEAASGVEIMVETNGVHTAIVMPLVNRHKDWREDFPASDLQTPGRPYTHLSISWGEREVFLNTPQWTDLRLVTALNALTGGDGLLHAAHYVRPAPGPDNRPMRISEEEYRQLVRRIEMQVRPDALRVVHPGYADYDVFYDAPGTYHIANSCNQWTSDTLAAAGIRTGLWTPFAGGVMKWVPR